jgi:hypothetical protein
MFQGEGMFFPTYAFFFFFDIICYIMLLVLMADFDTTKKIVFRHLQVATCTVTVHVANCWPRASRHVYGHLDEVIEVPTVFKIFIYID